MFGLRTPLKGGNAGKETKSPDNSGEEVNMDKTPQQKSPLPVVNPRAPPKPKIKALSQDSNKTIRKMILEPEEGPSEVSKYTSRTAEAKACLIKAKLHLGNSRNLARDIKAEVTQAIEQLYSLVKEAEAGAVEHKRQESATASPRLKGVKETKEEGKEDSISIKLIEKMEKHERLLKENNEAMERLRNALETQEKKGERNTYANVAATGTQKRNPIHTALHSIMVSSKNELETGEEVLNQIRETVNARDGWVKVERVRKVKDRRVIVGCATEEERKKVKERLEKANDRLSVEDVVNKKPLVMLKDVFSYNTDQEVLNALKNQNRAIFVDQSEEGSNIEICFRRKTRNPHACHIVMRVPTVIWQRMTEAEVVHIDLQKVRVVDHSPLVQCTLCLGYGHSKKLCKENVAKCSHCGGPHIRAECAEWIANVPPTCCNCKHAGIDGSAEHNAFSQACPVRRKWDALARSSIAYC